MTVPPAADGVTLSPDAVASLAADLPGWRVEQGRTLVLEHRFADFDAAFAFVGAVAALARTRDHHPDIAFGWGYAAIRLTTHAAKGLTERDVLLASDIDGLLPVDDADAP